MEAVELLDRLQFALTLEQVIQAGEKLLHLRIRSTLNAFDLR